MTALVLALTVSLQASTLGASPAQAPAPATSAPEAPTLDEVVVAGQIGDARALIAGGADVNVKDKDGVTPLMRAASAGRADMVRLLLTTGADANATTSGVTALMMASLGGYPDAIRPLLAAKADVRARDNQGRTALMAAASSGSAAAVEALLKSGADVAAEDVSGGTALTYAAAEGHEDAVNLLQKGGAKPGNAELILAAGRCNTAVVRSFTAAGMSVNPKDAGTTPLIAAAGGNCVDTVDVLVASGADLNAQNSDGLTPLIKASAAGYTEIVERLLAKGADMSIEDSLGRSAWMYAAMADHAEIADLFRKARAERQVGAGPIEVSSPAFTDNATLPREYTADGRNVSPPLAWSNLPAATRSIALVCEDPDAGNPPPFVHWVIYNIPPAAKGLPENIPFEPDAPMPAEIAGAVQGISGFRRPIYRGPAPPPGKPHHYHFVVYALDIDGLPKGLTRADLLEAIKDHVVGRGELVATYERRP
jgi:Raf kinase inhibitor-like YbhB/YbcL family protein